MQNGRNQTGKKSFNFSQISSNDRPAKQADYVLNRVLEELTGYLGEDLTPDEVIVETPEVMIAGKETGAANGAKAAAGVIDTEEAAEPVTDYGFSLHEKVNLTELVEMACRNGGSPEEIIRYNPEKDYFYRIPSAGVEMVIKPEEVVSVIVDYALEFTDENDLDAETLLEEKLALLKETPDGAADSRKTVAETLSLLEERYEGLQFPGKAKGTKAETAVREKFINDLSGKFRTNQANAAFLESVSQFTDDYDAELGNAFYAGRLKLPDLSEEAQAEFAREGKELIDSYESQPNQPKSRAQAEDKAVAYQRALMFYSLKSGEAGNLVKTLTYEDAIALVREQRIKVIGERDSIAYKAATLEAQNKGLQEGLDSAKKAFNDLDVLYHEQEREYQKAQKGKKQLKAGIFLAAIAGVAAGFYGHKLLAGEGVCRDDLEKCKAEAADLQALSEGNRDDVKARYDQLKSYVNSLPASQAELAIVANNPVQLAEAVDSYLERTGPLPVPGVNCREAARNMAKIIGLKPTLYSTFAEIVSAYSCKKASERKQPARSEPVVWFRPNGSYRRGGK